MMRINIMISDVILVILKSLYTSLLFLMLRSNCLQFYWCFCSYREQYNQHMHSFSSLDKSIVYIPILFPHFF